MEKTVRACIITLLLRLAAILGPGGGSFAGECLPDTIASLAAEYAKAQTDSAKIGYLIQLSFLYNDMLSDRARSDSLAGLAIRLAGRSGQPRLAMLAYIGFLESVSPESRDDKSPEYAGKALTICRSQGDLAMQWRIYALLSAISSRRYDADHACSYAQGALAIARVLKNEGLIAESYLLIGNCYESGNRKTEAFKNYLVALDIAGNTGDRERIRKCLSRLSVFCREAMLFDEAVEFRNKEIRIVRETLPVDSAALMWSRHELHLIALRQKSDVLSGDSVRSVIDFAVRTCNIRLKTLEFIVYRQYLLEMNRMDLLHDFYARDYPAEYERMASGDPEMYFRLKAYFMELEGFADSADACFSRAERLIASGPGRRPMYRANFLNRYGQFLARHGRSAEAIGKFTRAYDISENARFFGKYEYMLTAARNLETLYRQTGDYKEAWFYAAAGRWISDSISSISNTSKLMAEAIRQERLQKDAAAERDRQKIRQGRTQRNMLAGGVAFLVIITLLIYRNYRNQKRLNALLDKAKMQSDQLLHNILPHETAEELKATGRAKAKRFDEVTVMFTDFKDFTQASERMSAEELVDEINFYFSEFDRIISRHNIEKIKIIGDSYMCAGGLPVANNTHAADVVAAAVELQEFMISQQGERKAGGRPWFELRIGIHTGPVVAGIVGLKKFAYDIWGDTVNTASRMENAGEPNRVNISGATWEKVKDRFRCTYRGKVHAKHKGLIDMYFVDSPRPSLPL